MMRKILIVGISFLVSAFSSHAWGKYGDAASSSANAASLVLSGKYVRFTVLTERLVRVERSREGRSFDDRATFGVMNRKLPTPRFNVKKTENATVIETSSLKIVHCLNMQGQNGISNGEVEIEMLSFPFTTWTSLSTSERTSPAWKSSVSHIVENDPDDNLQGTMNYGPSFAGGLDCYSTPPQCEAQYEEKIGFGLLSKRGYAIVDDTNGTRFPETSSPLKPQWPPAWFEPASTRVSSHILSDDLYFLASPNLDYVKALKDWASVSGPPSLPPKKALGVWYSRYFPYSEQSYFEDVLDKYAQYSLPISVGVLDVPWHTVQFSKYDLPPSKNTSFPFLPVTPGIAKPGTECNGWDGYTFNATLFPDPPRFFNRTRDRGIQMIMSVHMQNGIDHCQTQYVDLAHAMGYTEADIAANKTIPCEMDNITFVENFFGVIADAPPFEAAENYWWLDYPGGASGFSGWNQQEPASLYWGNRMFAEHARGVKGARPVILARYGGMGQQRDGIGFSGDTFQSFKTLAFEVSMTPKASNVLFGWWSHDIGGNHNSGYSGYEPGTKKPIPPAFPGDEDPKNVTGSEMLLRWIQFGAFSPILRTHCEPSCDRYVWEFPDFEDIRAALRLRDALVPFIYTAGRRAIDSGISVVQPMYYSWPNDTSAYSHAATQYMFGEHILVAPVTSPTSNVTGKATLSVWFPPSSSLWVDFTTGEPVDGSKNVWTKSEIPAFVEAGTVIPMRDSNKTIVWTAWLGGESSGTGTLYDDAGDGLDYLLDPDISSDGETRRYSIVQRAKLFCAVDTGTTITFSIEAAKGSWEGRKERRCRFQLRGARNLSVKRVTIDGKYAEWRWGDGESSHRDMYTEPEGSLIVECGASAVASEAHTIIIKATIAPQD